MLFKLCPCIQKLCNVCYPPTPSQESCLDRTKKRLFTVVGLNPESFLVTVFPASENFDSDLELIAWMHNNIKPMPTQNPRAWAWVWAPNVGLCTMGHEVIPRPCKIYVISYWTCLGIILIYTKGKMSEWPWSSRSPKDIFQGLQYPLTWICSQ